MTHSADSDQYTHESHATQVQIVSALNSLAGVYLLVSGSFGAVNTGNRLNSTIAGLAVGVLASSRLSGAPAWVSWLNALIGAWLIISPWVYGYSGEAWRWNTIVVGIIILVLGIWSALASVTSRRVPYHVAEERPHSV